MDSVIERDMAAKRRFALPASPRGALTVSGVIFVALTFFIIAFPKGGIKIFEVPITFGYLLTTLLLLMAALRARRFAMPLDRLLCFLPCLTLALWSAFVVYLNGTDSVGYTISYFVSVVYLPVFGLIFCSSLVYDEHWLALEKALVWAIRFITVYGIFLFFYKELTGRWFEIPYLTINAADVGDLDDKFINRGGFFKLISTYNNGNLFGVSLAIIAPLYLRIERIKIMHWVTYAAMFLTLSRTAWIAIILIMVFRALSKGLRATTVLYLLASFLVAAAVIFAIMSAIGLDMSFIFAKNLGGRAAQLDVLSNIQLIPSVQTSALPEIVYLGVLKYFGIPGLILFVLHLLIPSILLFLEGIPFLSVSKASACFQGLIVYAIVAGADAGFVYIPVMMLFWMVAGLAFWYAHRQKRLLRIAREASR